LKSHQNDSHISDNKLSGNWSTKLYPNTEGLKELFTRECPQSVLVMEKFLHTEDIELRSVQVLSSSGKKCHNQELHVDETTCLFSVSMIIYLTPGSKKTMFYPLELLGPDVVNRINAKRLSLCNYTDPRLIEPEIKEV
jgi:hypothetical protein